MIQGKTIISDEVFVDIVRAAAQDLGHVTLSLNEGSSLFSWLNGLRTRWFPKFPSVKVIPPLTKTGPLRR